jgi:hypothetical protein
METKVYFAVESRSDDNKNINISSYMIQGDFRDKDGLFDHQYLLSLSLAPNKVVVDFGDLAGPVEFEIESIYFDTLKSLMPNKLTIVSDESIIGVCKKLFLLITTKLYQNVFIPDRD